MYIYIWENWDRHPLYKWDSLEVHYYHWTFVSNYILLYFTVNMFCVHIDDDILDDITEQLMMNVTRIGPSEDVSVK